MKTENTTRTPGEGSNSNQPTNANNPQKQEPLKRPNETERKPNENPDHTAPEKQEKGPVADNVNKTGIGFNQNVNSNPAAESTGNTSTYKPGFTEFNQNDKGRNADQDVESVPQDNANKSNDQSTSENV